MSYLNEEEIRKAISVLKEPGELFEIRIIDQNKRILSGYFNDVETMLDKLKHTVSLNGSQVYIVINKVNDSLKARQQKDCFRKGVSTTSDSEIDGYEWLFIDLDPKRATGISSSAEELDKAKTKAKEVLKYLEGLGFEEPVKALSGNGCHILYKIKLRNTDYNKELVKGCLSTLSDMFSDEYVEVDTTTHNPARLCKLYGTRAQKGANIAERPHRMSYIFSYPSEYDMKITDIKYLEKLAGDITSKAIQPNYGTSKSYSREFDIEDFMGKYGLLYKTPTGSGRDNSTIYELHECPFDHNHRNGDAKIFSYPDGRISFKCHHNSCSEYRWQDVRRLFEPEVYERRNIDDKYDVGMKQHNRNKASNPDVELTGNDMFRTAAEIMKDPDTEYEYIKTGVEVIDSRMGGLAKTELTAVSGLTGSGKSTLLAQIMLNSVEAGHRVVCYSGEMSNKKYINWLFMQAAGKHYTQKSKRVNGEYAVKSDDVSEAIAKWMGDNFLLYNNKYGNDYEKIEEHLKHILIQTKADLCVLDNLMILDISKMSQDKYEAQTRFVISLKNLAHETNTHIMFVAHPRKSNGFIRLSDIAGTANIGNILDNGFVIHRCNKYFHKNAEEALGSGCLDDFPDDATNAVEILKDREHGNYEVLIPLYYEPETKRLKNSKTENMMYSWKQHDSVEEWEETNIPF